nr:biotin/lipoyl-binding protein [Mobiluncus sp. Marseille-Q7826]
MSDEPVFTPLEDPTVTPAAAGDSVEKPAKGLKSPKERWKAKKKPQLGNKKSGRKWGRKKKVIIGVSAVAVLAIAGFGIPAVMGMGAPKYDPTAVYRGDVTTVVREDVTKTISMTGTLKSAKTMTLFSSLNSKVQALNVKAGDRVNQGQLLAQLDSSEANSQLASQQAQLNESRVTQQNSIDEAAQNYQNAKSALDQGMNQEIRGAQTSLREAETEYVKSSRAYEQMKQERDNRTLQALLEQENTLRSAYQEVENAKMEAGRAGAAVSEANLQRDIAIIERNSAAADLDLAKKQLSQLRADKTLGAARRDELIENVNQRIAELEAQVATLDQNVDDGSKGARSAWSQQAQANISVGHANENLGMARRQFQAALRQIDTQIAEAGEAVAKAQGALSDAKISLEYAKIHAAQEVSSNLRALRAAQASAGSGMAEGQSAIQKLRADISSAHVTSPMSGIVTSVTAKVGATPEGALMTVEDDQNMVIETQIKESGVSKLSVGNQVTFTTPATGDKEFTGVVSFISPAALDQTATQPSQGGEQGGGGNASVMFPVQITVTGDLQGLRLGSTAKVKAIVAGEKNALTVPKGALVDAMIPLGDQVPPSTEAPAPSEMAHSEATGEDGPKSVLVIDNPDSEKPKIREVQVEVLVEGNGMAAIKGKGIKEGTTVLDNAMNYVGLAGDTGHYVDTPPVMEGTVE